MNDNPKPPPHPEIKVTLLARFRSMVSDGINAMMYQEKAVALMNKLDLSSRKDFIKVEIHPSQIELLYACNVLGIRNVGDLEELTGENVPNRK